MKKKHFLLVLAGFIGLSLFIAGLELKNRNAASIGIIGGADGPTSIFVTGAALFLPSAVCIAIGIIIVFLCICSIIKQRKK